MRKNNDRRLEMRLKMTSNVGIIVFTLIGIALFLLTFLAASFTSPRPVAFSKILVGSIGGALFVGGVIIAILLFFRFLLRGKRDKADSHK